MMQLDLFEQSEAAHAQTLPAPAKPCTWDLRLGNWQDVLADVICDALICDPPYSARTHAGMRVGNVQIDGRDIARAGVAYTEWSEDDARAFVESWSPRVRGWFVVITDHVLFPAFAEALERAGRYTFQPLPYLEVGKQPRLTGDGPASWTCWILVARPATRAYAKWRSLPGGYVPPPSVIGNRGDRLLKGGKPLWLMQSLVRDYSRPGDLICDPCAGGATTLLAALIERRSAVGAEGDPKHHAIGHKRLSRGYTPTLFSDH